MSSTLLGVCPTLHIFDCLSDTDTCFKQVADLVTLFAIELFNCPPAVGHVPSGLKEAFDTHIVREPGLNAAYVDSPWGTSGQYRIRR